jgi:hypothetical protein
MLLTIGFSSHRPPISELKNIINSQKNRLPIIIKRENQSPNNKLGGAAEVNNPLVALFLLHLTKFGMKI